MPARMASGSLGQASTTAAKSGEILAFRASSAPHSAPLWSEAPVFLAFSRGVRFLSSPLDEWVSLCTPSHLHAQAPDPSGAFLFLAIRCEVMRAPAAAHGMWQDGPSRRRQDFGRGTEIWYDFQIRGASVRGRMRTFRHKTPHWRQPRQQRPATTVLPRVRSHRSKAVLFSCIALLWPTATRIPDRTIAPKFVIGSPGPVQKNHARIVPFESLFCGAIPAVACSCHDHCGHGSRFLRGPRVV